MLDRRSGRRDRRSRSSDSLFGPTALFAFNWQVALHGEPLTDEEMEQLAAAAAPVLRLRGAWTVVDPPIVRGPASG